MALMNGAELLMKALLQEGVKQVFGIPGSQTSTFIDAICRLGPSEGIEFLITRHNQLAESLGARGIRVEDPEDIRPALEEASKSDVMTVIDVVIDQEAHMFPPVVFDLVAELWLRDCPEPYCEG